ncbi:MAG: DUF1028 domain-containing protein [candidate division Zixibacteria bacterium]|nr:DUF1028 domain-containing protein [candidate division Zixibacteria bacterium]
MKSLPIAIITLFIILGISANSNEPNEEIATFSIAAFDPATGEIGVAVASRFFGVGAVVPWARAGIGAVATQAYANTTFGWRGLELMEKGATPDEAMEILLRFDEKSARRQVGIVSVDGKSATFTGEGCSAWAGGRNGENYAVQGNILAGEAVVAAMEDAFLNTTGSLADKMYAALLAGEKEGGDSRGKQSAAIYIAKEKAGYGGYTDQAIDIRVDDHQEPFKELGRLLNIAQMNYSWNIAWTLFTEEKYTKSLPYMEKTAKLAPEYAEVLYDLAVIRLAVGNVESSLEALKKAIKSNPKLKIQASTDSDMDGLRDNKEFQKLIEK